MGTVCGSNIMECILVMRVLSLERKLEQQFDHGCLLLTFCKGVQHLFARVEFFSAKKWKRTCTCQKFRSVVTWCQNNPGGRDAAH